MLYRLFALSFVAVLGITLMTPAAESEDEKLAKAFKAFLEVDFKAHPLQATTMGDHRYDDRLDDLSPQARDDSAKFYTKTRADLKTQIDYSKLSRNGQIDWEIFDSYLKRTLWDSENTNPFRTDPRVYNTYISDSVFLILTQSTLPKEQNIRNAASRIRHIPKIIEAAKMSLKEPSKDLLDTAIKQGKGSIAFYEKDIFAVSGEASAVSELSAPSKQAVVALKEYVTYLESLRSTAVGEWRIGKEKFAEKLPLELDAGLGADEVLRMAETDGARVVRDMYVIARQLWPKHFPTKPLPPDDEAGQRFTIRAVLSELNQDHGKADNLVVDARSMVDKIKKFIVEKDLLRLPEPDQCKIIEMPEFQRGYSVAYLNPAPPLDPKANSYYAISPPPNDWDDRRVQSFLQEYNRAMLQILTIHEAYPGHYVQLEYSNRHPSLIRKVLWSGVFAEGWAVYTEQMMLDQGFGEGDAGMRLQQLKWYLRAVTNAILDYKMHCTEMTDAEALKLLVDGAFQTEGEAIGKISRAKQQSCQLSTYFVGRMAFYRLRQEISREMGDQFHLGRFHEAVLDHGTLPVKYLPEVVRERLKKAR